MTRILPVSTPGITVEAIHSPGQEKDCHEYVITLEDETGRQKYLWKFQIGNEGLNGFTNEVLEVILNDRRKKNVEHPAN